MLLAHIQDVEKVIVENNNNKKAGNPKGDF